MQKFIFTVFFVLSLSLISRAQSTSYDLSFEEALQVSSLDSSIQKERLCHMYLNPLQEPDKQNGSLIQPDEALRARRLEMASSFSGNLAEFERSNENLRQKWISELNAVGSWLQLDLPNLRFFDDTDYCRSSVLSQFKGILDQNPPGSDRHEELQAVIQREVNKCLAPRNLAFAVEGTWTIWISINTVQSRTENQVRFILAHEMTHLKFPALQGVLLEEIFCDATAWQWILKRGNTQEAHQEIADLLMPRSEFADDLFVRMQLPNQCGLLTTKTKANESQALHP